MNRLLDEKPYYNTDQLQKDQTDLIGGVCQYSCAPTDAGLPDTRCVYAVDREADIVSLMARAAELEHPADWLIRSKHDRTLFNEGHEACPMAII